MKTIKLVALIALLAVPALAQKTVLDPNVTGGPKKVDESKPDTRLAQKLTYQAGRKTVSGILADLTKQTGVTLKAGINGQDWQVRDRKMNVFVKDVPLKELMNSIARVMKFQWASGGKGDQRTYRLFMDRKTLLDAEGLRMSDQERRDKELAGKRAKTLTDLANADQLSPTDLAKLKKDKPFAYLAVSSGIASGLGAFFKDSPEAMNALARGQQLTLSGAQLSGAGQSGLLRAVNGLSGIVASLGDQKLAVPSDLAANMGKVSVQLNQHMDMIQSSPGAGMMLGEMSVKYGDKSFDLPLLDPDSKLANLMGKAVVKSQDENRPIQDVMKDMQGEMMTALMSEIRKEEAGEASSEHPDDPALDEKVKMKPEGTGLHQVQQALQEASTFSVVSDSFGQAFGGVGKLDVAGEKPIKDVLKAVSDTMLYNWEKHGKMLEFRDKEWYRKRAAQIPQAWIDGWRNTLKNTGTLDIADLAQIAALTPEQVSVNLADDEDLSRARVPWVAMGNRELLKFYGSLTEVQRAALMSKMGLNAGSLTQPQAALAEMLIGQKGLSLTQYADAPPVFSGTKTEHGKVIIYAFTLTSSTGDKLAETNLTVPEYREPPAKASDDTKKAEEKAPAK